MPAVAAIFVTRAGTSVSTIYQFHLVGIAFAACHSPSWVGGAVKGDFEFPPIGHWDELASTAVDSDWIFEFNDLVTALGDVRIHFFPAIVEQIHMIWCCICPFCGFLVEFHVNPDG